MTETNQNEKKSICYACGQPLQKYSVLICADCLHTECENFEKMAEEAKSAD